MTENIETKLNFEIKTKLDLVDISSKSVINRVLDALLFKKTSDLKGMSKSELGQEFMVLSNQIREDAYANGMTEELAQEIIEEIS